ncbi:PAAR domain-containing protein [Roseibium sediminis]|uniref:PAAR domain-containing protein n=1 Tax=Roseibium sediminis TaxID=1775174 RepID=UPI00123D54E3|nr:PAAR domain-containing protein [Roseibium sediminis]
MPKAARLGDIGAGHGCFPPTPAIAGSSDTFINGRPAVRLGDAFVPHGCPNCPPHPRSLSAGSATVFINGKKAGRVGDAIGCGGSVSTGSGDTLIGDVGMGGPFKSCMKGAKDSSAPLLDPGLSKLADPATAELLSYRNALAGGLDSLENFVSQTMSSLLENGIQNALSQHVASLVPPSVGAALPGAALSAVKDGLTSDNLVSALKGKLNGIANDVGGHMSAQLGQASKSLTSMGNPLTAVLPNPPGNSLANAVHAMASGQPDALKSTLTAMATEKVPNLAAHAAGTTL